MVQVGQYNTLKVVKKVDFGMYLDGGDAGEILLPTRFVPKGLQAGDELDVFLYHDGENRLIATTQKPHAVAGDIALLTVVSINNQGAFLDWGLMKDIFLPLSQQTTRIAVGGEYLVKLYIDEPTGRIAATQRIERYLNNDELTVKEKQSVDLLVYQKTDIGYKVIINNAHLGVLHYNEVFRELEYGAKEKGYIKTIREDGKIDVSLGDAGYKKVETEADKILRLLAENDGYLPYHDKSEPTAIYEFFGISKKVFKMTVGALYKQRKIDITQTGIKLLDA
ncbi:RNA-binding protein [Chitinophagaceae bacterium IBVUCB1]|nr:RNA-binding protein [Chitinophagaceae bacterium IBVUCB1]